VTSKDNKIRYCNT